MARTPDPSAPASAGISLVPLVDGWSLWSTASLRSTGFPVDSLDGLAAHEAVPALDAVMEAEEALKEAAGRASDFCWEESFAALDEERRRLRRACHLLSKKRVPEPIAERPDTAEYFAAVTECRSKLEIARQKSDAAMATADMRISQALIEKAGDARFLEALVWQNRKAFTDMRGRLASPVPARRNNSRRELEQILVSYLQRFCMKNESIGFFGPIGWAELAAEESGFSMAPGAGLIADSKVHFEYWAIDALARALSRDVRVLPWLAPRIHPLASCADQILRTPRGKRLRLNDGQSAIFEACDGTSQALEIATKLLNTQPELFPSIRAAYASLNSLASTGAVLWELQIPVAPHPERYLRNAISRIGDGKMRDRELAKLDEMERILRAVDAARGNVSELNENMTALESHFEKSTEVKSTRLAGRTYVGRTLAYLDCRRDVRVQLGSGMIERLAPPLALILTSARWYSHAIAQQIHALAAHSYGEFIRGGGRQRLLLRTLLAKIVPEIISGGQMKQASEQLLAKWGGILEIEGGARAIAFEAARIRDRVQREFHAPGPGLPTARSHSPDVMIAARGAEAIRSGDYFFVLGETHIASNTLLQPPFIDQHPNPSALFEADRRDLGERRTTSVIHRDHVGQRVAMINLAPDGLHIDYRDTPSWRPREQVISLADIHVERSADRLVAGTSDGRHAFDLVGLVINLSINSLSPGFEFIKPAAHTPRVAIDRLVISREAWRVAAEDLGFTREGSGAARFAAARRWQRDGGLPRHIFVKIASEQKPFYMDFDSPISVERMSRYVRGLHRKEPGATVTMSEMLPSPDETWLEDVAGKRYCCELRTVVVDPLHAPDWPLS